MKRKNVTRNALVTSIIAMLLCVSMLVGTTFAWFTDSVTTTNNTITAGNLDIDLEYSLNGEDGSWKTVSATTELFDDATLWEPGHTEVVYLKITNKGTLALNYKIGLNAVDEKPGTNVDGKSFNLSEHIKFDVVDSVAFDRASVRAAALDGTSIYETFGHPAYDTGSLEANKTAEVALAVYMPETVGNEANYRGTVPYIKLGLNLVASQMSKESDSFGADYDGENNAAFPQGGTGSAAAPAEGEATVEVRVRNASTNANVAYMTVPKEAVDENAENIVVTVTPTAQDPDVTIQDSQDAQSFNIEVEGIKEDNTKPITVKLRVGTGLSGVKVFHEGTEIPIINYNENDGYVTFETTSFSPYTVVYDAEYKEPVVDENENLPKATVYTYTAEEIATLNTALLDGSSENEQWGSYGGYSPSDPEHQTLEAVYRFSAPHTSETVQNSKYKDWKCDFYVSMDRYVPGGAIFLGGQYGTFDWIGFENNGAPVEAGEEIALLGTAIGRNEESNWTYADIVGIVREFKCGVARAYGVDGASSLAGATFTVKLCLTDPETGVRHVANEVKYTFSTPVTE